MCKFENQSFSKNAGKIVYYYTIKRRFIIIVFDVITVIRIVILLCLNNLYPFSIKHFSIFHLKKMSIHITLDKRNNITIATFVLIKIISHYFYKFQVMQLLRIIIKQIILSVSHIKNLHEKRLCTWIVKLWKYIRCCR